MGNRDEPNVTRFQMLFFVSFCSPEKNILRFRPVFFPAAAGGTLYSFEGSRYNLTILEYLFKYVSIPRIEFPFSQSVRTRCCGRRCRCRCPALLFERRSEAILLPYDNRAHWLFIF